MYTDVSHIARCHRFRIFHQNKNKIGGAKPGSRDSHVTHLSPI